MGSSSAINTVSGGEVEEEPGLGFSPGDRGLAGDGFIVLDRLQQSAQLSSIPVIVLTARDPQYNRERTLKAGACAFLQKPAYNNELMDVIRTTLSPVWPGTAASALPSP